MSDLVVWTPNPVGLLEEAEKAKARSASFGGIGGEGDLTKDDYINIDYGMTVTRLLPPWRKADDALVNQAPFVRLVEHVRIPPDNRSWRCWRESHPNESKAKGVDCPICLEKELIISQGVLASYSDFKGYPYQKTAYYTNAYDRKREDGKARIIGVPAKPWPGMLMTIGNWVKQYNINVYDPIQGRDLIIHKDGSKNGPIRDIGYRCDFLPTGSPIASIPGTMPPAPDIAKIRHMLDHLWDLDNLYKFPSDRKFDEKYAEVRAVAMAMGVHYRGLQAGKVFASAGGVPQQYPQQFQPQPQQPQFQPQPQYQQPPQQQPQQYQPQPQPMQYQQQPQQQPMQYQQQPPLQQAQPGIPMAPITVTGVPVQPQPPQQQAMPRQSPSALPACYSNIEEGYESCGDCTYEIACRHQQKEKGKNPNAPSPRQVFPLPGAVPAAAAAPASGPPDDGKPY